MASAHPKNGAELDKQLLARDFLECPLCFDQFKQPKMLPCQHSFCLHCLQQYVAARGVTANIPCPLCNEIISTPGNDVSQLKNNFTLMSLSDFLASSEQSPNDYTSKGQECGACNEVGPLNSFCSKCELWLCPTCTNAHKRVPSTSEHCLSTDLEVNMQCMNTVLSVEKALENIKQDCTETMDYFTENIETFQGDVDTVKKEIQSVAKEARLVISKKEDDLLQKLGNFCKETTLSQTAKYQTVKDKVQRVDSMLQLLKKVKEDPCGRTNKDMIKIAQDFLSHSETGPCFNVNKNDCPPVSFMSSIEYLTNLKTMAMGCLQTPNENTSTFQLNDRPLRFEMMASPGKGKYITGLAFNRFSNTFVGIVNRESVVVFKPDSDELTPFSSSLCERKLLNPRDVACSAYSGRIFVSEGGKCKGDGGVLCYSHDGTFHSVVATGLTFPTAIAVYEDHIFVCDTSDKCVCILNVSGEIRTVLKKTPDQKELFEYPMYISVGGSGRFAVSDNYRRVRIFDMDCSLLFTYSPETPGSELFDVTVLLDGTVVVCDRPNGLYKISPEFTNNSLMKMESNSLMRPIAIAIPEMLSSVYIGSNDGKIYSSK